MKKWTWSTWLMAGGVAALFVVAGVLVVVGVVTHTEQGLTHPGNSWGHIPLTVTCQGYVAAEDDACDAAENAAEVVNHRLGFGMLLWIPVDTWADEEGGDIHITMRAPTGDGICMHPGECFELSGNGTTYDACTIHSMNASGGGDLEWLTVYHGIGHCLGLAHDDFEQSIMRPVQRATQPRRLPPWITDFDRALLRGKYNDEDEE